MSPAQGYASFVVRLWYADDLEPASAASEPLRGQIVHVQSDLSGAVQNLEEITRFIQAQLCGSHVPVVGGEERLVVTEDDETLLVEDGKGKSD